MLTGIGYWKGHKRSLAAAVALSIVGAAIVCAAPVRAQLEWVKAVDVEPVAVKPLASGPAVRLSRADNSDEDCIEVALTTPGPNRYGALLLTPRLSCSE
jgi:hypothetical protein